MLRIFKCVCIANNLQLADQQEAEKKKRESEIIQAELAMQLKAVAENQEKRKRTKTWNEWNPLSWTHRPVGCVCWPWYPSSVAVQLKAVAENQEKTNKDLERVEPLSWTHRPVRCVCWPWYPSSVAVQLKT